MSLAVDVYVFDGAGSRQFIDGPDGSDLAGHEVTRTELYGSACVIALGAQLLPLLAIHDIYAETPSALDQLDQDCALMLDNLEHVAEMTKRDPDYIAYRVGNIRRAIARAREISGNVVIW